MGLLDDAIREHLELKRLRGADPGKVAREEQDALGPAGRSGDIAPPEGADREGETRDGGSASNPDSPLLDDRNPSAVGQETVEINMDAELDLEAKTSGELNREESLPEPSPSTMHDSFEWEVPDDRAEPVDDDDLEGVDHEGDTRVEDVLEETPDFLRDTPEQERLWFEQRPPRDFDFNE
jgi:hypothetical protein